EVDAERRRERLAGRDPRRRDLLRLREARRELGGPWHRAGDLEVGCEVAVLARDERVLPGARRREEVERLAAAHHPRLRLDVIRLEPAALEDRRVRATV